MLSRDAEGRKWQIMIIIVTLKASTVLVEPLMTSIRNLEKYHLLYKSNAAIVHVYGRKKHGRPGLNIEN